VRELKTRYPSRLVLFDLPPVLSAADVLAFSPYVDCVLLVVEEGRTEADAVTRAAELLAGKNLIGTVLNKSRESAAEKRPGWLPSLFRRSGS
jgi:protein-tyrosine kinase